MAKPTYHSRMMFDAALLRPAACDRLAGFAAPASLLSGLLLIGP
jgi:hypothetical protein